MSESSKRVDTAEALFRFAVVPSSLVGEIREHAQRCLKCIHPPEGGLETRYCEVAQAMVERCVNFEQAKRHPGGSL